VSLLIATNKFVKLIKGKDTELYTEFKNLIIYVLRSTYNLFNIELFIKSE